MTTTDVRRPRPPAGDARRFADRARRERRLRWVRRVALLLVVALIGFSVWAVGWSTLFGVRQVNVSGEHRSSAGAISRAAKVPMERPLVRVDLQAIAHRVASMPTIAHVTVTSRWPHTIRISVIERVPVAVVRRGLDRRLVDAKGVDFAPAPDKTPYPLIDLDIATSPTANVRAGIAVIAGLPPALAKQLSSIEVIEASDVRLRLADNATVYWGNADDAKRKADVLAAMQLANPGAKTFNVSAPDAPSVIP